ncbi:MAG TPA: hypothetical protein VE404_09470 [Verrucomicrobiae bacterium]|nr:hypothetical protein [Verrucomicrobiae bacterium]
MHAHPVRAGHLEVDLEPGLLRRRLREGGRFEQDEKREGGLDDHHAIRYQSPPGERRPAVMAG